MRIVILGNGKASYCSERDYEWTFKKMGHEVIFLQETEVTGEKVLFESINADALMWVHTHGWKTPGLNMHSVLANLKKRGIPTFGYHLDIWFGLDRQRDLKRDNYWRLEYFFSCDKDMVESMNQNIYYPKMFYLPAGVVERDCNMDDYDGTFDDEIIFAGSYDYHPEWPYRRQLLDWLHTTYGSRFKRIGRPAKDQPDAKYVMGSDLNKIYQKTKIVVGDSFNPKFTKKNYSSNRLWETTGKGGFLIYPRVEGITKYFKDGEEVVYYDYNDWDGLKRKIDYYLDPTNEKEREKIRIVGHERCKKEGTFTCRLKEMLEIVMENSKKV
jgi:hypothetical protein